jgi:deoxyribonuclease-2
MTKKSSELNVLGEGENGVIDWWFAYKLPDNVHPKKGMKTNLKKTTGMEYMYFQPGQDGLSLSSFMMNDKENCVQKTLAQIYNATTESKDSLGWICYNDEIPNTKKNNGEKGHSKGVLAFDLDSDTAFWMLHSWPKFPDIETSEVAASNYGQTYLCVQLENVDAARLIAEQMFHRQEPQTYEVRLPDSIKKNDILYKVAFDIDVNETDPPCDIHFLSKGKESFRLMAKNRHWAKDFWIDLVGPHLGSNIDVETWRRGTVPPNEDSDNKDTTTDILYIDLEELGIPYEWHYTKDHAKWGISETVDWICVADINRQTSQEKRGGGAICFQNKKLWASLSKIEKLKE